MITRLLKAERMKLKHSPVWIAFLIMPIIPALLGTFNYRMNIDILTGEWFSLWTQHTLFTCYFFLPIMIGVYCSYLMHIEYMNHNMNKLLSIPQSRFEVILSKLITVSAMIFLSEIWIGILFVVSGYMCGLSDPPYREIITWCLFGTLGGIVTASIQIFISMFIQSFALPVAAAFAGGLSGLVFLAKGFGHVWPYSLMAYGMNSNSPQQMMKSGYANFVAICIVYIVIICVVGSAVWNKKDI